MRIYWKLANQETNIHLQGKRLAFLFPLCLLPTVLTPSNLQNRPFNLWETKRHKAAVNETMLLETL